MKSTLEDMLTADEVAELLGLNRKTVYEYATAGEIPCKRLGRRLLFYKPTILAWLEKL